MPKSVQLRVLMHTYADLHQPFHTLSLVTASLPAGDRHGHYSTFADKPELSLHSLWDSCFFLYPQMNSPLSKEEVNALTLAATKLRKAFPLSSFSPDLLSASTTKVLDETRWLASRLYISYLASDRQSTTHTAAFVGDM